MTAYATAQDLEDLSLPAEALALVSTTQKEQALEAASRYCDGYFRGDWGVPIPVPNADLKDAVCAIAAWRLMCLRGFAPEAPDANLRTRYDDAIKWLEAVRDGKCRPFADSADATPGSGESAPLMYSDCDPEEIWG